jgi:hypothetical protein
MNIVSQSGAAGAVFHLVPEGAGGPGEVLRVPPGPCGLAFAGDGGPRLVRHNSRSARLLLEPVLRGREHRLLLIDLGVGELWHNDRIAPGVVCLRDADQFHVRGGTVLEVALFGRARVGPPPPDCLGKPCPYCKVPFAPDTRVLLCAVCGEALHLEEGGEDEVLRCAAMTADCPRCREALRTSAGYLRQPEFLKAEEVRP